MFGKRMLDGICLLALMSLSGGNVLFADTSTAADQAAPLAEAAMQGDKDAVRSLLRQKIDVNVPQGDGMTALHWAAFQDDLEMSQLLIRAGANVKAKTRDDAITPLYLACGNGDAVLIESLLQAGADPNTATSGGVTVLMRAATSGSGDAVKVLLDHGAAVNAKEGAHGQTALMFAAVKNAGAPIAVLAARGANLDAKTNVVEFASNPKVTLASAMGGMSALLFAARQGAADAMRALIEAGADINAASASEHTTPLVTAIVNGHYDVAKLLLEHGANPNLANVDGLAALYATIDAQHAPYAMGTVLATAEEKVSYLDLMKSLLEHGANPNAKLTRKLWFRPAAQDKQWISPVGATPLLRAAQATDVDAMRLLVTHGADPSITTAAGDGALALASGIGWVGNFTVNAPDPNAWLDSVRYCLELGLDINAQDKKGFTPLMGAAWRGNNKVIQFLVEHGAKLDIRNESGWSVTDMANSPGIGTGIPTAYPETISLLLKMGAPALLAVEGEALLGSSKRPTYGTAKKLANATADTPPPAKTKPEQDH